MARSPLRCLLDFLLARYARERISQLQKEKEKLEGEVAHLDQMKQQLLTERANGDVEYKTIRDLIIETVKKSDSWKTRKPAIDYCYETIKRFFLTPEQEAEIIAEQKNEKNRYL